MWPGDFQACISSLCTDHGQQEGSFFTAIGDDGTKMTDWLKQTHIGSGSRSMLIQQRHHVGALQSDTLEQSEHLAFHRHSLSKAGSRAVKEI